MLRSGRRGRDLNEKIFSRFGTVLIKMLPVQRKYTSSRTYGKGTGLLVRQGLMKFRIRDGHLRFCSDIS